MTQTERSNTSHSQEKTKYKIGQHIETLPFPITIEHWFVFWFFLLVVFFFARCSDQKGGVCISKIYLMETFTS